MSQFCVFLSCQSQLYINRYFEMETIYLVHHGQDKFYIFDLDDILEDMTKDLSLTRFEIEF